MGFFLVTEEIAALFEINLKLLKICHLALIIMAFNSKVTFLTPEFCTFRVRKIKWKVQLINLLKIE